MILRTGSAAILNDEVSSIAEDNEYVVIGYSKANQHGKVEVYNKNTLQRVGKMDGTPEHSDLGRTINVHKESNGAIEVHNVFYQWMHDKN